MTMSSGLTLAHAVLNLRIPDLLERSTDNGDEPNFLPTVMKDNGDGSVALSYVLMSTTEDCVRQAQAIAAGGSWALVLDGKSGLADTPNTLAVFYGQGDTLGSVAFPYALPLRFGAVRGPSVAEARRMLKSDDAVGTHLRAAFESTETQDGAPIRAWTPEALESLDGSARAALTSGFAVVAVWIAGSDGEVDRKEIMAMFDWIAARKSGPASALFTAGPAHFKAVLDVLMKHGGNPKDMVLASLKEARTSLAPEARKAYTDELLAFGEHVARASGGSFLAFWKSKIGAEESAVLHFLKFASEVANLPE